MQWAIVINSLHSTVLWYRVHAGMCTLLCTWSDVIWVDILYHAVCCNCLQLIKYKHLQTLFSIFSLNNILSCSAFPSDLNYCCVDFYWVYTVNASIKVPWWNPLRPGWKRAAPNRSRFTALWQERVQREHTQGEVKGETHRERPLCGAPNRVRWRERPTEREATLWSIHPGCGGVSPSTSPCLDSVCSYGARWERGLHSSSSLARGVGSTEVPRLRESAETRFNITKEELLSIRKARLITQLLIHTGGVFSFQPKMNEDHKKFTSMNRKTTF